MVATDYENYAFVYACMKVNVDGTCAKSQAWVYSPKKTLADKYFGEIKNELPGICISKEDFLLVSWDTGKFKLMHSFTCKYTFNQFFNT